MQTRPVVELLRLVVALAVVGLLGRAARPAWRHRALAFAVWRRIRLHHVAGCIVLLAVVLTVAVGLLAAVPFTRAGIGSLVGLHGNVIFAPLEEVAQRSGSPVAGTAGAAGGAGGGDWALVGLVTVFGAGLLLLFPWLAYVEERVFRTGLEDAGLGGQAWTALKFGLLHMIMFIPLAAALAVGVAGFVYGWIYRHAYRRSAGRRRSARAGPFGVPLLVADAADRHGARADALFTSTVWHVTFNSLIVLLVVGAFVADAL